MQVPKGDVTPATGLTQGDAVHFLEFHSGKLVIRQNMMYFQFRSGATGGTGFVFLQERLAKGGPLGTSGWRTLQPFGDLFQHGGGTRRCLEVYTE